MKAMVGSSVLPKSFDAGVETAKKALKGIKKPRIGLLQIINYCSLKSSS